jgi:integrase
MASVHRRKESKYWAAAWRDKEGRLHSRSTKLTDRIKAQAFAVEMERAARHENLVEAQARQILGDLLERVGEGERLRNPGIEEWFREWLRGKEAAKTESTGERYAVVVEKFIAHLKTRAPRPLAALTTRDIQNYATARQQEGLAGTTVALDLKVIRTCLNAAVRQGLVPNNPAAAVELPHAHHVERGTFTATEVKMLCDAAEGEWPALILLGYFTGQRLSDCCKVKWENIDFNQGTITMALRKPKVQRHVIPLHPTLHEHLEKLASSDKAEEYVLAGMAGLGTGGRHGLTEGFKRIVVRAGLDLGTVQGSGKRKISRRTFHAFRHSFTSAMANAGIAPELRMKITGHKSAKVHAGYTHHELAVLKGAVEKIPALPA